MLELALNARFARDLTAEVVRPVTHPGSAPVPVPVPRAAHARRTTGRALHALAARIEPRSPVVGA